MHEFVSRGLFEPNLERVVGLLRRAARRDARRARPRAARRARSTRPEGGYFLWLELDGVDAAELLPGPRRQASRSSRAPTSAASPSTLRLAYSFVSPDEIAEGVARLASVARSAGRAALRKRCSCETQHAEHDPDGEREQDHPDQRDARRREDEVHLRRGGCSGRRRAAGRRRRSRSRSGAPRGRAGTSGAPPRGGRQPRRACGARLLAASIEPRLYATATAAAERRASGTRRGWRGGCSVRAAARKVGHGTLRRHRAKTVAAEVAVVAGRSVLSGHGGPLRGGRRAADGGACYDRSARRERACLNGKRALSGKFEPGRKRPFSTCWDASVARARNACGKVSTGMMRSPCRVLAGIAGVVPSRHEEGVHTAPGARRSSSA